MRGKKGSATAVVLGIILVIIIIIWLINIGGKECRRDSDCGDEEYCNSDFSCNKIPVIEKITTPIIVNKDYSGVAKSLFFLGLAVIIGAIILKHKRNKKEALKKPAKKEVKPKTEPAKKLSRDSAKLYVFMGLLAGALIVFLIVLIALLA
ncbi:hypothetical protein HQ533_03770 [Candidatus Woesearchaeota archaeon]|nr:hypothetical protein [Candidatus Woesearchaeota archaeon]